MKHILKTKTFWLNVFFMASFTLEQAGQLHLIDPAKFVYIFGIANILNRFLTSGAVSLWWNEQS